MRRSGTETPPGYGAYIGTGTAETATTNLMIVIEPGETAQFGWISGMGVEPATDLLPADTIATMLRLLDDSPIAKQEAITRFMLADGQIWLFAISRVMPFDGPPDGSPTRICRAIC
jgi:hypothetical protein